MMRSLFVSSILCVSSLCSEHAIAGDGIHTFDGKHDLQKIEVTAVYFVPKDRSPLPDWRARLDYFARRLESFHHREFDGESALQVKVQPEPLRSSRTAEATRGNDPNETYHNTMKETSENLKWPPSNRSAFPILLVFSEINWRELDDFRRIRVVDGVDRFEGNIDGRGRHFPGAESGGARAMYQETQGCGLGLVSADGWRVPYSGSDCVAYHEGLGHTIGLPHPDPIDGSVMGLAQYQGWLNETFVNEGQKRRLGWDPRAAGAESPRTLFDSFTALPEPTVPRVGQPVSLILQWPKAARVKSLQIRYQTELTGPWIEVSGALPRLGEAPRRVALPAFDRQTPVSYRVDASLVDGQRVELWGYFQVK